MRLGLGLLGALSIAIPVSTAGAATLDAVKARGQLVCGTSPGVPGFSLPDAQGHWNGLDVDFCKAVAAAIFGDTSKIKYVPLNPKDRFAAVQSGEVDVLSRQTTWSLSRDTSLGLSFSPITYFDGQALMVKKALGIKSAKDLNGATICVQGGTTTELNIADFFQKNGLKYDPVSFASGDEAIKAFEAGRCDAFTTDASALHAYRLKAANPQDFTVLPELISKEPLGPAVRRGDEAWANEVGQLLEGKAILRHTAEDKQPIDDVPAAVLHGRRGEWVQKQATFHCATLVRDLAEALGALTWRARRSGGLSLPGLEEYFAMYNNDDRYLKGRRTFLD